MVAGVCLPILAATGSCSGSCFYGVASNPLGTETTCGTLGCMAVIVNSLQAVAH